MSRLSPIPFSSNPKSLLRAKVRPLAAQLSSAAALPSLRARAIRLNAVVVNGAGEQVQGEWHSVKT